MSHSVTIQTRTVTSGSPTAINRAFCRSYTGLCKVIQVALGAVSTALVSYYLLHDTSYHSFEELFFLVISSTFFIGSFILVLSSICSFTTESIIAKTIYELLYHAIAFCLLLTASITFLTKVNRYRYGNSHTTLLVASIIGLINSLLYFLSTIWAFRSSRGL